MMFNLCAVQVFRVASVCLGSPPETICWEYRDKDKNFHRMGPITPQEFYSEHVKPLYNIQDKVCGSCDILAMRPVYSHAQLQFLNCFLKLYVPFLPSGLYSE